MQCFQRMHTSSNVDEVNTDMQKLTALKACRNSVFKSWHQCLPNPNLTTVAHAAVSRGGEPQIGSYRENRWRNLSMSLSAKSIASVYMVSHLLPSYTVCYK